MKKNLGLLIVLAVFLNGGYAVQTGELPQKKSVKTAMLLSALFPGAGEVYAGNYKKGAVFMATEVIVLFAHFRFASEVDYTIDSYKQYARAHAGVDGSFDDDFANLLQKNYSTQTYNDKVERTARNYYLIHLNDEEQYRDYLKNNLYSGEKDWEWDSQKSWKHYVNLRGHKQDLEIYAKFALGAALVNRIISVVSTSKAVRKYNRSIGNVRLEPTIKDKGIRLVYEYKF